MALVSSNTVQNTLRTGTNNVLAVEGNTLFNINSADTFIGKAGLSIVNSTATAKTFAQALTNINKVGNAVETAEDFHKQQLENMTTAVGAMNDYIEEYLYDLVHEKETTTLKALIAEPAAAAGALIGAGAGIKGIISIMTDRLTVLGQNLVKELAGIPEVQPFIQQINNWLTLAETIRGGADTIEAVQKIIKALEPIVPVVSSVADLALAFWSGGATIAKNLQTLAERVQLVAQQAIVVIILTLRSFILNMKITVPKIIVLGTSLLDYKKAYAYVEDLKDKNANGELDDDKLHWALSMLTDSNSKFIKNIGLFTDTVSNIAIRSINVPSINISDFKLSDLSVALTQAFVVNYTNTLLQANGVSPIPASSYKYVFSSNEDTKYTTGINVYKPKNPQDNESLNTPPKNDTISAAGKDLGTTNTVSTKSTLGMLIDEDLTEFQIYKISYRLNHSSEEDTRFLERVSLIFHK